MNKVFAADSIAASDEAVSFGMEIDALIKTAIEKAAVPDILISAVSGNVQALVSLGRCLAQHEGYLLQSALAVALATDTKLIVLPELKIRVPDAAVEIVRANTPAAYDKISIDSDIQSCRTTYKADLVIVDPAKNSAWIIDVKRSASESASGDLLARMRAAALALPDILWKEHKRIAINAVSVCIIDGSKEKHRPDLGIWSARELDVLLGCKGLSAKLDRVLRTYRSMFATSWQNAKGEKEVAWAPSTEEEIAESCAAKLVLPRKGAATDLVPRSRSVRIGLAKPHPLAI